MFAGRELGKGQLDPCIAGEMTEGAPRLLSLLPSSKAPRGSEGAFIWESVPLSAGASGPGSDRLLLRRFALFGAVENDDTVFHSGPHCSGGCISPKERRLLDPLVVELA